MVRDLPPFSLNHDHPNWGAMTMKPERACTPKQKPSVWRTSKTGNACEYRRAYDCKSMGAARRREAARLLDNPTITKH
jgi:hypothetical protein